MNCPRTDCKNKAEVHPTFGVIPCKKCRGKDDKRRFEKPEFYSVSKQNRIVEQRDKYEKDMIPPYWGKDQAPNPEFAKAYPELAKEYFSPDQLAKL